jgi:hypothetical protein
MTHFNITLYLSKHTSNYSVQNPNNHKLLINFLYISKQYLSFFNLSINSTSTKNHSPLIPPLLNLTHPIREIIIPFKSLIHFHHPKIKILLHNFPFLTKFFIHLSDLHLIYNSFFFFRYSKK